MDTVGNSNSQNQNVSYFDGNTWQLIGYRILSVIVCTITLGIAYPWMLCMVQGWETGHTVINGRRLKFNGHGHQLIGKYLLWVFLTIITLGIYGIWLGLGMKKWVVKHTVYADEEEPVDSYFSGGAGGYFGIHILSFMLTFFTLGFGKAWAKTMVLKWEAGHTHIGGSPLEFSGTGGQLFVKYLLLVLLTPLTLGIYALCFTVIYMKWQVKNKDAVYQTPEIQVQAKAHETTVTQDFVKYRLAANDQEVAAVKSGYTGKEDNETLERLAEENNPFASYHLAKQMKGDGALYEGRALELLQKAADGKYHPALLDLAKQLPPGQALSMLTEAAQCGNAEASWLLAAKYQEAADLPQAAYWFKVALEWGVPDAKNRVDEYDALVKSIALQLSEDHLPTEQKGNNVVSLVLGAFGLLIWIIPIGVYSGVLYRLKLYSKTIWTIARYIPLVSLLIGIVGLVLGIVGIKKKNEKGGAITNIVLNVICIALTIIVYGIGWYQRNEYYEYIDRYYEDKIQSLKAINEVPEFTIRDKNGNILMTGGIASASVNKTKSISRYATLIMDYVYSVEIQFTAPAADAFRQIISDYKGETIDIYLDDEKIYTVSLDNVIVSKGICTIDYSESYEYAEQFAASLRNAKKQFDSPYYDSRTEEPSASKEYVKTPVMLGGVLNTRGRYYTLCDVNGCEIEYIIDESAYFDREEQVLYIQFGVAKCEVSVQLRCENGWCTQVIASGYGITEVSYPYVDPPSGIEVWTESGYLINSHPLNVTEGTSAEVAEWLERKYGSGYYLDSVESLFDEIDFTQGTYYSVDAFGDYNNGFEYMLDESAYFDREEQFLYIQFGLTAQSDDWVWLRFENGWFTVIAPGTGITAVRYPFEEPPSSVEVWSERGYLINSHSLKVTEVTSAQVEEWRAQNNPAVSEMDISKSIVGEWEYWREYTNNYTGEPQLDRSAWIFFPDGTYDFSGAECILATDNTGDYYYNGQYWWIGTGAGESGSYVLNGNEITVHGTSSVEDYEFTSVYTVEILDGEVLYMYSDRSGEGIGYQRVN